MTADAQQVVALDGAEITRRVRRCCRRSTAGLRRSLPDQVRIVESLAYADPSSVI